MQRVYNQFSAGVQQDDFLTNGAGFIEHKNIDGLRDGYGVTLGPKVNKSVLSTEPLRATIAFEQATLDTDKVIYAGDDGKIYNASSDTAIYTLTNGGNITAVAELGAEYYFFYRTNLLSANTGVAKVSRVNVEAGTITGNIDETYKSEGTFSYFGSAPIIYLNNKMYVGDSSSIKEMDAAGTIVSFGFPDSTVVAMTKHNSVITVYCQSGTVYMWDGVDTTYLGINELGARISKVAQRGSVDHVTTEDGQAFLSSGLQFQRLTKPKKSNRMNDNSSYDTRLSFTADDVDGVQNRINITAGDDVYLYSNDTIKGIYKYGKLIPGMQDGFHKIITQNHLGTQIDYIYDMYYYDRIKRVYFSYKAGSSYGVDYIDLDSLEACTDAYMVSEVFSGGTSFLKKVSRFRRATSNTSGNNYIKLYYRVNNKDWVLLENINAATDEIDRRNITNDATQSPFNQFVDVQLKIEFHNDDGGEDAPTLHDLMNEYEAIET